MRRGTPLALVLCALPLLLLAACGDDAGKAAAPDGTLKAGSTAASLPAADPKPLPQLSGPASKFSILLEDIGLNAFITDIPRTFELDAKTYGGTKAFPVGAGEAQLKKWQYLGGYETAMDPEGRDTSILNGGFSVHVVTDCATPFLRIASTK